MPEIPSPRAQTAAEHGTAPQVLVVRGAAALEKWQSAWQQLADGAGEPNVFYEPWMLLPALKTFASAPAPDFYLIFSPGRGPDSPQPQLCGFFPLVRGRHYKGVRTATLSNWKYLYCALGTPLVRRGHEDETVSALLDFLRAEKRGAALLELQCVSADGAFGRALVDTFNERAATTFVDECWTRAVIRPHQREKGEDYLHEAVSGKRRKEFRRKEHRLADAGALEYRSLEAETAPAAALDFYIAEFLRVEASGWKGETGSALACDPAHQEYFRAVVTQAHALGRLNITLLQVGGHAIAAKCDLLAGTGGFAFKIGFDEQFARFSPGVLLEMERVRQLHDQQKIRWMDSCAVRNHPMINRLWLERRTLQTVVIATGRGRGEFIVAGLSLLRHFKRVARRTARRSQKQPLAAQNSQF